jgi:hypothetical protein
MTLAELNIARLKYPQIADFTANANHGGAVCRIAEE